MSQSALNYTVLLVDMTKFSEHQVMDLVNAQSTVFYKKYNPDDLELADEIEQAYKERENFLEDLDRQEMELDTVDTNYFERDETQEDL